MGTPYLAFNKSKGTPYLGNLPPTRKRRVIIQTSKLMIQEVHNNTFVFLVVCCVDEGFILLGMGVRRACEPRIMNLGSDRALFEKVLNHKSRQTTMVLMVNWGCIWGYMTCKDQVVHVNQTHVPRTMPMRRCEISIKEALPHG